MRKKTESEQCIGALEAAIKVLTGAGQAKKGGKFLETLQEAQLLSTLGSLRGVLGTSTVRQEVPEKELDMVRDFINNPDDFLRAKDSMSALQMGNPFGDFAPKSGQIQGILKGMYDDFTGKLEKSNVDESKKQKAFEALMDTKKKEEKALEATLQRSEKDSAEKTKGLADSKSSLDDTKKQLEADEIFFSQSKQSCKDKAQAWAERTRLRAEELQGMNTAISILSSDEAKKTFENATTTFLQLSAAESGTAYKEVRAIAEKFGGPALAQVAAEVKSGGHFDKVIHMIENMILKLKEEGQDDIKHRDLCETKQDKNKKTMEDLDFDIDKLKEKLDRMGDKKKDQRSKEFADFSQATKDDLEAIQLIQSAIVSLSKFYQDNNIKMTNLMQGEPEKAPDTWEDDSYGGKKSESTSIISILTMIKDDLVKEVEQGKDSDAASQVNFANDLKAIEDALDAQKQTKAESDMELAEVLRQLGYRSEDKEDLNKDLDGEKEIKEGLEKDCDWIKSDFDKRAANRKLEIEGLQEAKHFLAGAVVLPPKSLVAKKASVAKSLPPKSLAKKK